MRVSKRGIKIITEFEGFKNKAYRCPAGVLTIGYGHTKGVKEGDTCTSDIAMKWLKEDCEDAEETINTNIKITLSQNQFDALVSFIFNLGSTNFIRSTLLIKINERDSKGAADEFGKWTKIRGCEISGLIRRRAAEKELFLS